VPDTEDHPVPTRRDAQTPVRPNDVSFTTPPAREAEARLRQAMGRPWNRGDSFLWIGPFPVPLNRSACREWWRKIMSHLRTGQR
jgi:hypothetical protein